MVEYKTQKEKVIEWVEKGLIPKLPEKDYSYQDIISGISLDIGTSEKIVEDVIKTYIKIGKIKHLNLLVATDDQLREYMKKQQELKAEADKIIAPIIENKEDEDVKQNNITV